nr:HlyD family type I secretion periplasmic adaptor subunit [uncultured Cohaesibacter sp.]
MSKANIENVLESVTSVKASLIVGITSTLVFMGGFAVWAFGVPLSGAIIAQGTVITDGNLQVVRHERGGALSGLFVKEGEHLKKGQVIATLSRPEDKAAAAELKARIASLSIKQIRLEAESRNADSFGKADLASNEASQLVEASTFSDLITDQMNEFTNRKKQLSDTIDVLLAQKRALQEQKAGTQSEVSSYRVQFSSLSEEVSLLREAARQGYGRANVLRERERSHAELKGKIEKSTSTIASYEQQIDEVEHRISAERSNFMEKVSTELAKVRAERMEAVEALSGKVDAVARIDITAPVDGVVNKLHINTIGSAVEPFAPMVEIVSDDQPLLIEAKIQPADVDQVYPKQKARAVLSAFNRRLYDPVSAEVTFVGADARQDRADEPPYYTVRLRVDETAGAQLPSIVPGMPSEVYLTTYDRTFADYIAEPFVQSFQRAFRQ